MLMKKEERILQELGEIDPAFVAQADPARPALSRRVVTGVEVDEK